jgi:hypothetical protein
LPGDWRWRLSFSTKCLSEQATVCLIRLAQRVMPEFRRFVHSDRKALRFRQYIAKPGRFRASRRETTPLLCAEFGKTKRGTISDGGSTLHYRTRVRHWGKQFLLQQI